MRNTHNGTCRQEYITAGVHQIGENLRFTESDRVSTTGQLC